MKVLNMKQICEMFSITRPTVYKWMKSFEMPHYKIGDTLRFEESEVTEWFKNKK